MKGSSSDRGLLLAAVAMTVGTLAVAGLAGARALRAPHSTATAHPLTPALSPAGGEGGRSALPTVTATATPTPIPTSTATSDGFADERPPRGPPAPTPTLAAPDPPPVVRRAPRERIQVPRTVSAWGT